MFLAPERLPHAAPRPIRRALRPGLPATNPRRAWSPKARGRRARRIVEPRLDVLEARRVLTTFTMLSPTSPGPLSGALTPVGGIVIDLFGTGGGRIETELGPSELYSGAVDGGLPVVLGSKAGFSKPAMNTLGGGIESIAVRVTMFDGETGLGDPWRDMDALLVNGVSLGGFSQVATQQTSGDGQTELSLNPAGGFRSDSLDTGFFASTDPDLLARIFASISATGRVELAWQSTAVSARSLDFTTGLAPDILAASNFPVLAFNPPIITDVKVGSPIDEGSTTTIEVTAFNLHRPVLGDVLTYQFDPNNDGSYPISNTTGIASIGFDRPGSYVVPVRVYNIQGARAVGQALVEVRNVAPTVTPPPAQQAVEGSVASLSLGRFGDPGRDDPWTVVVDWGDGSAPQTFNVAQTGDLGAFDHLYARAGSYSVDVQVSDLGGLSGSSSFAVAVANVAPTVTPPGDQSAVQGISSLFTLGSFTDPGRDDPWIVAVDWGDGSAPQIYNVSQTGDLGSLAHSYAQAATYDVSVSVVDLDGLGLGGSSSFRIVVQVVAPSLASPGDQEAVEGAPASIALGSLLDAGPNGPWTVRVDWGDGSSESFKASQPGALPRLPHTFPKAGRFPVTVLATSENGLSDSVSFGVDVANLAPSVASPDDQTTSEGTASFFDLGSFRDAGDDSPWMVVVDWGDGSKAQAFETSRQGGLGSLGHAYGASGRYTVSIRVVDGAGMSGDGRFVVDVANVAPSLTSPGDQSTLEGASTTLKLGRFTDPGADSPWTIRVSWSDGFAEQTTTVDRPGDLGTVTRVFGVHGVYQATVEATDARGLSGTSTFLVVVGDVAPEFAAVAFPSILVMGEPGALSATFHDPGFLDQFHVRVDWGDQTSTDLGKGLTARDLRASHVYAAMGTYQVAVTVVDLAGESATARLSVAVGAAPSVAPPTPTPTPTPEPAAHPQAPPIGIPVDHSLITSLEFYSSSSKGKAASPASPPKGLIPTFPKDLAQGLGNSKSFAKFAPGAEVGEGGRSLEEILAILLKPPKIMVQVTSATAGAGAETETAPRGLVATAGPRSADLALAGLADPEAVSSPVRGEAERPRGKAARVMILVVAWTVSLRNHRGSSYSRRSGRYRSEKARASAPSS